MIHSITVLAQLSDGTASGQGPGGVVVVGFLFVVLVLAVLASVTAAMGAWFTKQAASSAAKAAEAAKSTAEALSNSNASDPGSATASSNQPAKGEEDPAFVAVIAASVHTVIGDRPHRVVSIRSAGPGWAQEGRRQIFSSHRVR